MRLRISAGREKNGVSRAVVVGDCGGDLHIVISSFVSSGAAAVCVSTTMPAIFACGHGKASTRP